jgi:solute carrier family 25 protein 33/36
LWYFISAKIDEHSSVPKTHCTNRGNGSFIQGVGTESCWSRAIEGDLFLHIQSDEGGAQYHGVGFNKLFKSYVKINFLILIFSISTDSPYSHILSAMCAGFASSTSTNPIWFVKTRLQLDFNSENKMTVRDCIRNIYQESGLRGFYKGITASYFGISETVVHFVIYETLKRKLVR